MPVVLGPGDQVPLPWQPELVQGHATELGDVLELPGRVLPHVGQLAAVGRLRRIVHHERHQDARAIAKGDELMHGRAVAEPGRNVHELSFLVLEQLGQLRRLHRVQPPWVTGPLHRGRHPVPPANTDVDELMHGSSVPEPEPNVQ